MMMMIIKVMVMMMIMRVVMIEEHDNDDDDSIFPMTFKYLPMTLFNINLYRRLTPMSLIVLIIVAILVIFNCIID